MKKNILGLICIILMVSCSKEKPSMIVKGEIKGLRKGMLYLKKKRDTSLIAVDSVKLFGKGTFELSDNIDTPEVYYLVLNDEMTEKTIMFFGEKSTITINDNIQEFGLKTVIKGSENQEIYAKYLNLEANFRNRRLDVFGIEIMAKSKGDTEAASRVRKFLKGHKTKRLSSIIQFAINNKDYEVSPYVTMNELLDANIVYLDSINNSLTSKVKKSIYGRELQIYIDLKKAIQKNKKAIEASK